MHITENRSGSAKMKQVSKILIPANSSVELKPGGAHLMLIGPRRDVKAGEQILMIAQDSLERRFMLKFTVIDMRQETSHNDHNHHNHNH